ncbi:MAG: hypothetical protein J6X08_00025 [Lachnospiraceae bacterium]|nr:hypothetical protein [Lachnospiraceae bacterium]
MIKKLFSTVMLLTLMAVSLTACDKKEPVSSDILPEGPIVSSTVTSVSTATSASVSESVETSTSEDVSAEPEIQAPEDAVSFEVVIINQCKADIGMVSVINPFDESQMDIGELPDGGVLNLSYTDWPKDVTAFDVAFYNKAGKMVSSSSIDITGVTKRVTISLSGDKNIDKVKGTVE